MAKSNRCQPFLTFAAAGLARTAADWTAERTAQTHIVLVAPHRPAGAEIRHRLATPLP